MKLEKKHLAAYLPYGLKGTAYSPDGYFEPIESGELMRIDTGITRSGDTGEVWLVVDDIEVPIMDFNPILYSLDYLKNINSNIMSELNIDLEDQIQINDFAFKRIGLHHLSYGCFQILVENKFDIFNLIKNNLAIAVTEDFNPYK